MPQKESGNLCKGVSMETTKRGGKFTAAIVALLVGALCTGFLFMASASPAYAVIKVLPITYESAAGNTALDTMEIVASHWMFGYYGYKDDIPPRVKNVVIVTNESWHDAAAAQALAGIDRSAVLLTEPQSLSSQTFRVIAKLQPEHVVVVGGPLAISDDVVDTLERITDSKVERIWGENAVETALACYREREGWGNVAFVATSGTWQDAVSAGPYSYNGKLPMFLADANGILSDEVFDEIIAGDFSEVVLMGGELAIPESEKARLQSAGLPVERMAGENAVDTCARTIDWAKRSYNILQNTDNICMVATANDYHDASIAAACCGRSGAYLVLVGDGPLQPALETVLTYHRPRETPLVAEGQHLPSEYIGDVGADILITYNCMILGGNGAIPQTVRDSFPEKPYVV